MSILEQLAYKLILGKSHTNKNRLPFNEPYSSSPIIIAENIWADPINRESPNHSDNFGLVSDLINLKLVPIQGANRSSFTCHLSNEVPLSLQNKINPITRKHFQPFDRVGNILSMSFGFDFRPKLFNNDKEISLLDSCNWLVDHFAGIVTQEGNRALTDLQAYIYIGKNLVESLNLASTNIRFFDHQTINNGIYGVIDGVNNIFNLISTPDMNSEHVYINGVLQNRGELDDYTIIDNVINFNSIIPQIGDNLIVSYRTTISK
jgi:hypothetical protein